MEKSFESNKKDLLDSLLLFTQVFYKIRTGRAFDLSFPIGRESHFISICKALIKVFDGKTKNLIINIPPRYAKTELVIHFIAWALAQYQDSNFLYVSYSHSLAKKQTATIKNILQLKEYQDFFGLRLKDDAQAKDNFETVAGGSVYAAGAGGTITGRGAGIHNCERFGGFIAIDDIHKPDEVTSDTIRKGIIDWYYNTLQSRLNSPHTPIVFIGQRLHEDDLAANLLKTGDWDSLILPAIDETGNALYPEMHSLIALKKMREENPYTFSSQYQQDPQPAGGGIFKPEWFQLHEYEPNILSTFITVDGAETEKEFNDATVFSFFGIYKIKLLDVDTDLYGIHWIDCEEIRIEPKDIEAAFLQFYVNCMKHKVKPSFAAIEKKSSGVTLISLMKKHQGISLIEMERSSHQGTKLNSKINRFLYCQPFISKRLISLPTYGRHTKICIEHCRKITANNTHAHDDIADTLADAIQLTYVDKVSMSRMFVDDNSNDTAKYLMSGVNSIDRLRKSAYK